MPISLGLGLGIAHAGNENIGSGPSTPSNAMLWPDGTVMQWPDGTVMLWPT